RAPSPGDPIPEPAHDAGRPRRHAEQPKQPGGTGPMSQAPNSGNGSWNEALVMMVDDEALLTDVIQSHLEDAGYSRFVTCNDPVDALRLIASSRPDILLLDLMMPNVSGFDILQAVRA